MPTSPLPTTCGIDVPIGVVVIALMGALTLAVVYDARTRETESQQKSYLVDRQTQSLQAQVKAESTRVEAVSHELLALTDSAHSHAVSASDRVVDEDFDARTGHLVHVHVENRKQSERSRDTEHTSIHEEVKATAAAIATTAVNVNENETRLEIAASSTISPVEAPVATSAATPAPPDADLVFAGQGPEFGLSWPLWSSGSLSTYTVAGLGSDAACAGIGVGYDINTHMQLGVAATLTTPGHDLGIYPGDSPVGLAPAFVVRIRF